MTTSCRVARVTVPREVSQWQEQVELDGNRVRVELFVPKGLKEAPVAVVVHGFSRSRLNMTGWGSLLASNGFTTAVPDLPHWANHQRNARAITELLEMLTTNRFTAAPKTKDGAALVGFSMGGLVTVLAASSNAHARCWVGLDPVNAGKTGIDAAKNLSIPAAILKAEPAAFNAHGNARQFATHVAGPLFELTVDRATHVDPENPTDWMAELACGKSDPARRRLFEEYTVAVLRSVFYRETDALQRLENATNRAGVKEITARDLHRFPLAK